MKIAFLLTDITRNGGVQSAVKELINGLPSSYEITIISLVKTDNTDKIILDLNKHVEIIYLFNYEFQFVKKLPLIIFKLNKVLKRNVFDVVIANGIFYAIPLTFIKNKSKIIVWAHSSYDNSKKFGLNWLGKQLTYLYMDDLVVITENDLKKYAKDLLSKNVNIHQVYNLQRYKYLNSYSNLSKNILTIGSVTYIKGHDRIVNIAGRLFQEFPEWSWYICGDGPELKNLEQKLENLKMTNIKFLGNVDNVEEYYKNSSFFVLPSRSEGFGMVLLEAKMHGLPIISFECNGIVKEIFENNVNGYIVPDNDLEYFYNKIKQLISSQYTREKFSDNTILNNEKFSENNILNTWINIIEGDANGF